MLAYCEHSDKQVLMSIVKTDDSLDEHGIIIAVKSVGRGMVGKAFGFFAGCNQAARTNLLPMPGEQRHSASL